MASLKDAYLILYNLLCCGGWAMVLSLALMHVYNNTNMIVKDGSSSSSIQETLSTVYVAGDLLAVCLSYAQSAAVMEIVHAALGLVRSPVMVTTMQVGSRIVALFALVNSPNAQAHWGAGLMILSWSMVEVPRYAFYVMAIVTGDATKGTPYPLFWCRYSLFAVLYPTGITGELLVFMAAAKDPAFVAFVGDGMIPLFYGKVLLIVYALGSPIMILNMVGNRKSAFKKRFARPPPPPRGLVWPVTSSSSRSSSGKKQEVRSSTPTAKAILAAAVGAVNPDKARAIEKLKNWRFGYVKHLEAMVEEQCQSEKAALAVAQAGLAKAYELFQFVAADGSSVSFEEAMKATNSTKFHTGFVKGTKTVNPNKVLEVPYKGTTLSGKALKDQVKQWVDYGTIEPSAGEAIANCVDDPKKYLNLSDRYFVLLGAGSAMGPFLVLMALGANVVAIDLDRPGIWKRLIGIAKESSGSLTFPMKVEQSSCKGNDDALYAASGCNLFTETPLIRDWLLNLYPGKPFTVGCYAYLDGALHVQVSLAMDAICRDLSEKRRGTSLAYLCTPTDLHLITKEAHEASLVQYKVYSKKLFCIVMKILSRGKFLRKNAKTPVQGQGGPFYLVNGISVAQGPNYALAKRMQHWRAIVARSSKGCIVSSNIAPATSTVSVVHNRTFAWAYEGMPYFEPYEIFQPQTSNAVMSAILLSDLTNPKSAGNPKTKLANPNQLFQFGSFNGGAWRCAYEVDSIGEASVLIYFARVAKPYAAVGVAVGAVVAAKVLELV